MSTWFANARRRLKKENKMTWEPKNKLDDEDVDVSDDEDKDNSFSRDDKSGKHPTRFFLTGYSLRFIFGRGVASRSGTSGNFNPLKRLMITKSNF